MAFLSINPTTEEQFARWPEMSGDEVDRVLQKNHEAFLLWKKTSLKERCKTIQVIAKSLIKQRDALAKLMAQEMGKPLAEGQAEIEKCASVIQHYSQHAEELLKKDFIKTEATKSYISYEPLGVVFGIMPWNFPFWQVFRFAIPTLCAGNSVVVKHAENVPSCAQKIEEIFAQALLPDLYRNLFIPKQQASTVIEHPLVRAVSLTGSVAAGSAVAKLAGSLIKKTVLELGGSDAYIVLEDADLAEAAKICVKSRLLNNGQSCISAKRFIIVESVYKKFADLMVAEMKSKTFGDPQGLQTTLGPLARKDLRDNLHHQVSESIKKGARCLVGGSLPTGTGYFYPPTVLGDVQKGMKAFDEEVFGPVAALMCAKDEKLAIALANDTPFGLGAAVFTSDQTRGQRIAQFELQAGSCFVNENVRSDPRLPFGGIKQSGYGRELSAYGIKEFVNIKTVLIA